MGVAVVMPPPVQPPSPLPEAWLTAHAGLLRDTRPLSLTGVAASPGGVALVAAVVAKVAESEAAKGIKPLRRQGDRDGLQRASGAIVGGVLRRWLRDRPFLATRTMTPDGFTGLHVGYRVFRRASGALIEAGLLAHVPGVRFVTDFGELGLAHRGRPGLYWPTAALLAEAERHGVTAATIADDFAVVVPKVAPKVVKPVIVRTMKARPGATKETRRELPLSVLGPPAEEIAADVVAMNEFAARHRVEGCMPPRWFRAYVASGVLGGRWTAVGSDLVYQTMPSKERLRLRIDGAPVAEIDVSASHLSLLHGVISEPMDGDPYAVDGIPRAVAKRWTMQTIGTGRLPTRWSQRALADVSEVADYRVADVGAAMCDRLPALRNIDAIVQRLWLPKLAAEVGHPPRKLLALRLQGLEAAAITLSLRHCRRDGILALPVHDSLIVRGDQVERAKAHLVDGYWLVGRVTQTAGRGA